MPKPSRLPESLEAFRHHLADLANYHRAMTDARAAELGEALKHGAEDTLSADAEIDEVARACVRAEVAAKLPSGYWRYLYLLHDKGRVALFQLLACLQENVLSEDSIEKLSALLSTTWVVSGMDHRRLFATAELERFLNRLGEGQRGQAYSVLGMVNQPGSRVVLGNDEHGHALAPRVFYDGAHKTSE